MSAVASEPDNRSVAVLEPRVAGPLRRLRDVYRHRHLVAYFGRRGIERLYGRTTLGRAWLFIRPGMDLIARALIFGGILAAPSEGIPYLVFLATGTAIWIFFERGLLWATRSIEMNRRLVNQVYFPRLTLWLASTFPSIVEFGLYAGLAAGFIAIYSIVDGHLYLNLSPDLLLVFPAALLCLGLFLGIGLWTSVLGARTRDMRFAVRYLSSFWYFLTPVVIPLSRVPEGYRAIVEWNPATPPVEMFKLAVLDRGTVSLGPLVLCVALIVVLWVSGLLFYSRVEAAALDRL